MSRTTAWHPAGKKHILSIAGDIGGTNSRFALYEILDKEEAKCLFHETYKNESCTDFLKLLGRFVDEAENKLPAHAVKSSLASCCLAVAGPVYNNTASLTNINFVINGSEIASTMNIERVKVINDFVANGYGILTLKESEIMAIHEGECKPIPTAPIFCIGAGTGLGECYLTPLPGGGYEAWASEGGHAEFAPRGDLQIELLSWLQKKFNGRISVERVVSGKGLVNVYEFLSEKHPEKVIEAKHKKIMEETEGARCISEYAYDYSLAGEAMEIFLSAYGSEIGNGGLKFLPYGGIYIAGGIATKHKEKIKDRQKSEFLAAFHDKGRLSGVLAEMPLYLVESQILGLRGAQYVAERLVIDQKVVPIQPTHFPSPVEETKEQPAQTPKTQWGWVEDAVYASGIACISLLTLFGAYSVYSKMTK